MGYCGIYTTFFYVFCNPIYCSNIDLFLKSCFNFSEWLKIMQIVSFKVQVSYKKPIIINGIHGSCNWDITYLSISICLKRVDILLALKKILVSKILALDLIYPVLMCAFHKILYRIAVFLTNTTKFV